MEENPARADMFSQRSFMSYLQNKNCSVDVVKQMIVKGADVNYKDSSLNTPIHIVLQHSGDKLNLVRELLAAGVDLNACNKLGRSPLHYAVLYADDVNILGELIDQRAIVRLRDGDRNSPLHLAVQNNKRTFVEALIRSGADVNKKNLKKRTPLIIAVCNGNLEIVKLLLSSGASVSVTCGDLTPLHVAVNCSSPNQGILIELMKYGADMFSNDGCVRSPLHCALRVSERKSFLSLFSARTLLKCGILYSCGAETIKIHLTMLFMIGKLIEPSRSKKFLDECTQEVKKMKEELIHKNFSLFDFVKKGFESDPIFKEETAYRKRIFNHILYVSRKFPLYADVIAYHLGKLDLRKKAMELCVYTLKESWEGKRRVFLTPDLVFLISQFLSNGEMFNFITAFSGPQDFANRDFGFQNLVLGKSVKRKLNMIC